MRRGIPNVSIYKPKGRSKPQHKWLIAYYEDGGREVESVSTDLDATRQYAIRVSQRLERKRLGLVSAEDLKAIDAAARPLAAPLDEHAGEAKDYRPGHLEDYRDWLVDTGNTTKQADEVYSRCRKALGWCAWSRLTDLSAETLQGAVSDQKGELDWSNKTANDYLKSPRQFVRWLRRFKRLGTDPLEFVTLYPTSGHETHVRRALTVEELAWLLQWVETADPYQGISGPERAKLYFAAAHTGLRKSELASLTPESFDLDGKAPLRTATVTVAAAHSKHRRTDVQPLRRDVAEALRPWLARKKPAKPVFGVPDKACLMVQSDFAAARLAWLAAAATPKERAERCQSDHLLYVDGQGRVADFHSLRHTYGTILAAAGADISVVRDLMRHSDIRLTQRYVHPSLHDVMAALDGLPPVPAKPQPQRQRATGTYGAEVHPGGERGAQRATFPAVPEGSLRFPLAPEGAETYRAGGVAQETDRTETYAAGTTRFGHRSTEPKVAGSSPASCIHPSLGPAELSGGSPESPRENQQAVSAPGAAPCPAAPATGPAQAPPIDLEELRRIYAQLSLLLGHGPAPAAAAAPSPHPSPVTTKEDTL